MFSTKNTVLLMFFQSTENNRTGEMATFLWSPNNYHVKIEQYAKNVMPQKHIVVHISKIYHTTLVVR